MKFLSFSQFVENQLEEQLLKFNGQVSPKFGNIIVLAGGAASGKGSIQRTLLHGFTARVFDPDHIKEFISKNDRVRKAFYQKYKNIEGADVLLDIKNADSMKDSDIVGRLHVFLKKTGAETNYINNFLKSQTSAERLPNVIIDGTLKNTKRVLKQLEPFLEIGYKPENIHLVWVLNTVENTKVNNASRDRHVPNEIVINSIVKATENVLAMLKGDSLAKIVNGDWYVAFNEWNANLKKSNITNPAKDWRPIICDYAMLKKSGKTPDINMVEKEVKKRIKTNVPNTLWDNE